MRLNNIRVKIRTNTKPNPHRSALTRLWSNSVQGLSALWDTDYYT